VKYLVKLNDEYVTKYDGNTGYMEFGAKENALRFNDCNDALVALVDVIWGGSDEQPKIVEVEE